MFLFKKIMGPLLFPLSLCLEIILLGLVFLWFTRRQRTGKLLVTLGTLLILLLSYRPVPDMLLKPLERQYSPVTSFETVESLAPQTSGPFKWIVVLSGGQTSDPYLPLASRLSGASLIRLVEGIQLSKELPGARLILSGGIVFDRVPEAEVMAQVARSLGVKQQDLILESASRDTEEQARRIKELVGKDPFVLVTSASHMPRTVALFKKSGLEPLPCPVGHQVKESQGCSPGIFFPGVGNLGKAEMAFYEYLGLTWAKLRGVL